MLTIFTFLKQYWRETLIGLLLSIMAAMSVNISVLETQLSLSEQETAYTQDRLKVSNASIAALEASVTSQNEYIEELKALSNEKIEEAYNAIQKAKQDNLLLQEQVDELTKIEYNLNLSECDNIKQLLEKVGVPFNG